MISVHNEPYALKCIILIFPHQHVDVTVRIEFRRTALHRQGYGIVRRLLCGQGGAVGPAAGIGAAQPEALSLIPVLPGGKVVAPALDDPLQGAARLRQIQAPARRGGIDRVRLLRDIPNGGPLHRSLPLARPVRLVAQQHGLCGGVVVHLHPQKLADGPDGQVVGLAAGGVRIEDGGGDGLSVGGSDGVPGGDGRPAVHGHIGEVEGHLARCGQSRGPQRQRQRRAGKPAQK